MIRAGVLVTSVCLAGAAAFAQAPAPVAFEVASVRENTSASESGSISGPRPGRFTVTNTPLRFILSDAFQARDHELVGAPDWTWNARYDIAATFPPGAMPERDWRLMLQQLLADRFGLVTHRETRELPTYHLVMARADGRLGPQLTRSDVDCQRWLAEKHPQLGAGGPSPVMPSGQRPACMLLTSKLYLSGGTRTIQQLTASLQALTGRPVVDRTGLTGAFNMDMKWSVTGDDGASIFTALQEQLGLKLEPGRGPFEVVVIDKIQRPTPD